MVLPATNSSDIEPTLREPFDTVSAEPEDRELIVPEPSISRSSKLQMLKPITENNRILWAAFAAMNVLLFWSVLQAGWIFTSENRTIHGVFCVVTCLFAGLTLYFSLADLVRSGLSALGKGRPTIESSVAVALLAGTFCILWGLLANFSLLTRSGFPETFVFLLFLLTVWKSLSTGYGEILGSAQGFDLRNHIRTVSKIVDSGGSTVVTQTPLTDLSEGDRFRIVAGEMVPADARIVDGVAQMNERKYGGRTERRYRSPGQYVFAGSHVLSGELVCEAVTRPEDATITNFSAKLRDVLQTVRQNAKGVGDQVPSVNFLLLFVAACTAVYWAQRSEQVIHTVQVFMAVLLLAPLFQFFRVVPRLPGLLLTDLFMRGAAFQEPEMLRRLADVKRFVILVDQDDTIGLPSALDFELLDTRVDRGELVAILLSLLGGVDRGRERAMTQLLATLSEQERPLSQKDQFYEVEGLQVYADLGVCGNIKGIEFSVGNEDFLVERGVQLAVNEIEPNTEQHEWIYVAVAEAIVARFKLARPYLANGKEFVSSLRKFGIRCSLISMTLDDKTLDGIGTQAGLDLGQIHGKLTPDQLDRMLREEPNTVLFSPSPPTGALPPSITLVRTFDDVQWDLNDGDMLLFDDSLMVVPEIIGRARNFFRIKGIGVGLLTALGMVLLFAASFGFLPPLAMFLSVMIAAASFSLLTLLFLPALPQRV